MPGGGIRKWPLKRRLISVGATFLGRLLFPEITDPVSGFFAVRKSVLDQAVLKPRGYKILLEVLGKGSWEKEMEIPFEFIDREAGSSKLKIRTIIDYARQVTDITLYSFFHHESAAWREWKKVLKFGLVGLSGVVVNEGVLIYLKEFAGMSNVLAPVISIEISILNNFLWNDIWTFRAHRSESGFNSWWYRLASFQAISAMGSILNFAIYLFLTEIWAMYYPVAMLIGILAGFAWNFTVNRRLTWLKRPA
jgi:dolichol-phosphate mannosyltransferase